MRPHFKNAILTNNGLGVETGEEAIENGTADAVVFARAFISNPDLVERIKNGWILADSDP